MCPSLSITAGLLCRVWMALGLCPQFGEVCALVDSHGPPAADLGVPEKAFLLGVMSFCLSSES